MTPNVWVVLVNYNGLEDTRLCLQSIERIAWPNLSTVVIDNASTVDPTPALGEEFPWCHLRRSPTNGGWAGGNNAGIRFAMERGADQIILLNNDTIVDPALIERLSAAAAGAGGRFGVIGPIIHAMAAPDEVMTDGCDFNPPGYPGFFRRHPVPVSPGGPPEITEVDIVNGCCMMVAARVVREIGQIDERFFLIHEESDFCLRAGRAGFACGVLGEAMVWHKGSSSFGRAGDGLQRYYDTRNLYLLLRKHRAHHHRGRGALPSWLAYFRYVYHRYTIEREQGQAAAADAVIRGLCDAVAGRYGPQQPIWRPMLPVVRAFFELGRRLRARPARE